MSLDEAAVRNFISALPGVDVVVASAANGAPEISWGTTFSFYDPEKRLEGANKFPFATMVNRDYDEFDKLSNLDREGVFRLNVGISRKTYESLFPAGADTSDFSVLDRVMPHPVYHAQHWICVLNPGPETFESIKTLIAEAHARAASRYRALEPS